MAVVVGVTLNIHVLTFEPMFSVLWMDTQELVAGSHFSTEASAFPYVHAVQEGLQFSVFFPTSITSCFCIRANLMGM